MDGFGGGEAVEEARSLPFLCFILPISAQCSLSSSNFLDEISSLSNSNVFLYFFALITNSWTIGPNS